MDAPKPIVVDFAPHAIHYAGGTGARWYVSLVQSPWLLTLDEEGAVVGRVACPNVHAVVDGVAIAFTRPRVHPANVKRDPPLGPWDVIAYDVESGKELWRRERAALVGVVGSRVRVAHVPDGAIETIEAASGAVSSDEAGEADAPSAKEEPRAASIPGGLRWASGDAPPRAFAYVDDPRGGPRRRWDWDAVHVEDDTVVVVGDMRVLRVPLAADPGDSLVARVVAADVGELPFEPAAVFFVGSDRLLVDHASRGRFWFDVADTGLAKGDAVEIGGFLSTADTTIATILAKDGKVLHRIAPPVAPGAGKILIATAFVPEPRPRPKPPRAFAALVDALAGAGLLDPFSPEGLAELYEEYFGEGFEVDATTAGNVLAAVHPAGAGAERGVVVHDHRFGNETDDVVAELAATLGDEPIAFAQLASRADALHICAGGRDAWVPFDRGGLEAIVGWMNRRLDEAGATRRIHAFDTGGDDHCFVVCRPDLVAELERRGVRGLRVP